MNESMKKKNVFFTCYSYSRISFCYFLLAAERQDGNGMEGKHWLERIDIAALPHNNIRTQPRGRRRGRSMQEREESHHATPRGSPRHATPRGTSRHVARHVTPRHATPRHAPPRHATPRGTPRHATPRYATPRHATPRHVGACGFMKTDVSRCTVSRARLTSIESLSWFHRLLSLNSE
jgi:hypothetical protein